MTSEAHLDEFALIEQLLAPLSAGQKGAFGLTNDAATLSVPAGHELVVTKDMMVAGVHFLPDDPPDLIARKLLRVNLSDLAAMGARPWAYTLGLALPSDIDDAWLRGFAAGLAQDQAAYDITLAGGDTVSTAGPLTLSLTAMGLIEAGQSLQRSGAQDGDLVCVTGTIGDAALGLGVLQGKYEESSGFLEDRYRLPQPRCVVGQALTGLATAALDVSDGLVADVGHLARASGVELVINAPDVPLSPQAATIASDDPATLNTILTGGDDYELVFTIPEHHLSSLTERTPPTDVPITVIGHVLSGHNVLSGHGVTVLDRDGMPLDLGTGGYRHR